MDHVTIIWSDAAFSEIVAWLDAAFEREREQRAGPSDPRGPVVALLGVLMALVLPGLGLLIGALTPTTRAPAGLEEAAGPAAARGGAAGDDAAGLVRESRRDPLDRDRRRGRRRISRSPGSRC